MHYQSGYARQRGLVSPRLLLLLVLAAFMLSVLGCGVPGPQRPEGTYGLDFTRIADPQPSGAIVFYVDGVNQRIFTDMLAEGELPNLQRYFIDRGLYVPRTVCNVPSVTLPSQTSFVTGCYPGHHGVMGINWFDRNQLIWRNYETIAQKNMLDTDHLAPTIYEHLADRTTFSIFFQAHRGATKFVENWTSAGPPYFFGMYEFVDRLTLSRLRILIDVAETRREFPAFTVAYMLAPDFRGYGFGVESDRYRAAMQHTDTQIGRVLADLDSAGLLDKLIIAFVSDHGMSEVTHHFDLRRYLRDSLKLAVAPHYLWENVPFERRLKAYQPYDTVLNGSGDRYAAICLRRPLDGDQDGPRLAAWPVRPEPAHFHAYPTGHGPTDLIADLVAQPAVDALAHAAGENTVVLHRKTGAVVFRQPEGRYGPITYEVIAGDDPLGWHARLPAAMRQGQPAAPRQWLTTTAATGFPGLPAQLVAYFRAPRAGDLVLFAAPGYDFDRVHRAGHGGLNPEDMIVPMMLAGPGVPPGRVDVARTVDLMPTLLFLLGRDTPLNIDGEVLPAVLQAGPMEY